MAAYHKDTIPDMEEIEQRLLLVSVRSHSATFQHLLGGIFIKLLAVLFYFMAMRTESKDHMYIGLAISLFFVFLFIISVLYVLYNEYYELQVMEHGVLKRNLVSGSLVFFPYQQAVRYRSRMEVATFDVFFHGDEVLHLSEGMFKNYDALKIQIFQGIKPYLLG
jgi:hypothetical protein